MAAHRRRANIWALALSCAAVKIAAHVDPRLGAQIKLQWKAEKVAFNRERAYRDKHDRTSHALPDTYLLMKQL